MDLERASALATTVANFHEDLGKWGAQDVADCIEELVARVQALTDAGNHLAEAIKAQVEHGYPVSISIAAARADWRKVTG